MNLNELRKILYTPSRLEFGHGIRFYILLERFTSVHTFRVSDITEKDCTSRLQLHILLECFSFYLSRKKFSIRIKRDQSRFPFSQNSAFYFVFKFSNNYSWRIQINMTVHPTIQYLQFTVGLMLIKEWCILCPYYYYYYYYYSIIHIFRLKWWIYRTIFFPSVDVIVGSFT
jgi:hypothetical protein